MKIVTGRLHLHQCFSGNGERARPAGFVHGFEGWRILKVNSPSDRSSGRAPG